MAISTGQAGGGIKAEPNVTPMIDVMLVLLIIFMLVVPQLLTGFNATPPSGVNLKPHPTDEQEQLLGISSVGTYYLNKQPVKPEDLGPRLKQIYDARTEDKILYVRADRRLKYARVLDAIDIASKNGVRMTAMITEQIPGTQSAIETDRTSDEGGGGKK